MIEPGDLKNKLAEPAMSPANLADLTNASAILKNLADAEKSRVEAAEAQNKSEVLRFWIPVIAPSVTAFALVATLLLQMYQLHTNATSQRAAAEDAAWRETTRDLRVTTGPGVPIALHQLRSFLGSARYGRSARELGVTLLADLSPEAFDILLPDVLRETDWSNVSDLARLARGLDHTWNAMAAKADASKTLVEKLQSQAATSSESESRLQIADEQRQKDDEFVSGVIENLRMTSKGIADFIRMNSKSRPDGELDLKGADFLDTNLSSLNLSRIDLTNGSLQNVDIHDSCICDTVLAGTTLSAARFDNSAWRNTAWWRAGKIDGPLLSYLVARFPFQPRAKYAGDRVLPDEYSTELARLRKVLADTAPQSPSA